MRWLQRQVERWRSTDPLVVDGVLAVVFTVAGVVTVFAQDLGGRDGLRPPGALAVVTAVLTTLPVALRRRAPLPALLVSTAAITLHILAHWPEGSLPLAVLFLTYSVGACGCPLRTALVGLVTAEAVIVVLGATGSMGLDAVDIFGIVAQFAAAWAVGVAVRNRRVATDARVREASERAEAELQSAARRVAEERLRIARELHDIVAHSVSVVAVQAGVGAHVLDEHPEQARAALDAISVTSRGTLAELRRLLGVLRDTDGARSAEPAPGLDELPGLVAEVRAAGVPVTLRVEGDAPRGQPGIELSAYRIVQEALTNVIKHAGSPSRVDVIVRRQPGEIALEVVDDGDGSASAPSNGSGHGVVGMRERVGLWGGELAVGPRPGGGYRVAALLPCRSDA